MDRILRWSLLRGKVPGQHLSDPIDLIVRDHGKQTAQVASGSMPLSFVVSIRLYIVAVDSPPLTDLCEAVASCSTSQACRADVMGTACTLTELRSKAKRPSLA